MKILRFTLDENLIAEVDRAAAVGDDSVGVCTL